MQRNFFHSFDILRGLFCIIVMVAHILRLSIYDDYFLTIKIMEFVGRMGVATFFLISGYLFLYLLEGKFKLKDYPKFLKKRFFRVYPIYFIGFLLLILVINIGEFMSSDIKYIYLSETICNNYYEKILEANLWDMISNLFFVAQIKNGLWINPVSWSLGIEMQFYLIIGFLVLILKKIPRNFGYLFHVLFLLSLSTISLLSDEADIINHFPSFVAGFLVYYLDKGRISFTLFLKAIGVNFFLYFYGCEVDMMSFPVGVLLMSILVVYWKPQKSYFRFFSEISYTLYILHLPIIFSVVFLGYWFSQSEFIIIISIIIGIYLTILVSYYLNRYIEKPFTKIGKI